MIKVIGKRLLIPNKDRLIGFEGDNQTGRLYFSFRKEFFTDVFGSESDLSVSAKLQASGASKAVAYVLTPVADLSNAQESVYELEILSGMVQAVGEIKLQIIILKDMGKDENQSDIPDLEWNSETQSFYACDSLDFETYSGSTGSTQLDAFKEILSKIGAKATSAAESATEASGSAASAKGYAETAAAKAASAAESAAASEASAGTSAAKASEASSAAGAAGRYSASAAASSEAAEEAAKKAAASATAANASAAASATAKSGAESAKEAAETAKAAALNAANDAKNEAFAAQSLAQLAMDASGAARAGAKSASDNAAASLSHMNEAARYSEEAKAAVKDFDGHIGSHDNPHKVTASQVGAYSKAETDTALAGKLDKVKSLVRVYPGVYATEDTDGTPQLITATSDLSYIGAGSGYIPLYAAGGQLKTAEPTADDSAANKGYVDSKVSGAEVADGNVVWGGKNREDSFGPIDAAMIPTLGANRFAFIPAEAIEVEYSRDGGITWLDYEATDGQKTSCFSGGAVQSSFAIGKSGIISNHPTTANDQLRITITQSKSNVYNRFHKFLLYIITNSSTGCKVTIQGLFGKNLADETAYKTLVDKIPLNSGWGGYTVINNFTPVVFGAGSNHYGKLRFIFTSDGITTPSTTGLTVQNIYGFGGVGWKTPSNLAKFGYIYKWDFNQNVTFPNRVLSSNNPIGDSDLTNKKYVDSKTAALTNPYKLIETITLTEATEIIERNSAPNGTAYAFTKVLITVDTPKADTAAQQNVRLYINDGTLDYYAYYQSLTTYAKRAHFDCVVDNGVLKIRIGNGATNYGGENTGVAAMIENANIVFLSAINKIKLKGEATFAVGTIIKIYGVRA